MTNRTYVTQELVGTSTESIDVAVKNAISRAAQTIKHIDWFEVVEIRGHVRDDAVEHFQVTLKIGSRLEDA